MKKNNHNNSSFNKKLKSYGALAAGVLAVGNVANAQIILTDVNPDEIITGDSTSYLLDLNNDGVKDYRIVTIKTSSSSSSSQYTVQAAGVYPLNQNEILVGLSSGTSSSSNTYIKALIKNDQIDANQVIWSGTTSAFVLAGNIKGVFYGIPISYQFGVWDGVTDKYMGVKFDINGSMHYGWVRMDVSSGSDTVVLKSFAYNSVPNQPLLAGEDGVGFGEGPIELDFIKVSAYHSTVSINAEAIEENAEVIILDAQGRHVHNAQIGAGLTEITLDVATGVYFVNIRYGDAIMSEKVIIE